MDLASTQPGTEMKVTPEMEVPIIPIAIKYQGDWRFAMKNEWLSEEPLLVRYEMRINIRKYPMRIKRISCGDN